MNYPAPAPHNPCPKNKPNGRTTTHRVRLRARIIPFPRKNTIIIGIFPRPAQAAKPEGTKEDGRGKRKIKSKKKDGMK
jgi:hypothetical protein